MFCVIYIVISIASREVETDFEIKAIYYLFETNV